MTEYPVPTSGSEPYGITAGSDGNLWFTESAANKIGKITTSGIVTEYTIPTSHCSPLDITTGPDGNMWFVESAAGKIGMITPAGQITEYTIPTSGGPAASPRGITAGPDGALWFGDDGRNAIGRITTTGTIKEYPIPTAGAYPAGIAAGQDGNLWFTESQTNKIGKITTGGRVSEYNIPTANSGPTAIVAGPDGNLWFTEYNASQVANINPQSTSIQEYSTPTGASIPDGIGSGPDGNVWFAENGASQLASVSLNDYTLSDVDGSTRTFSPSANGQYLPTQTTEPSSTTGGTVTSVSTYQAVSGASGGVEEPLQTVAAAPGVTCSVNQQNSWQQPGCRTLTFTYATSTIARSDCPSGWGDYPGRLTTISFIAYDTTAGAYETVPVARYCYDSTGLLRAEFDPRISPALVTTYTYDSGDRVTSVAPPGLNAWTIHYGTIPSDTNPGRLISVSRQDPVNGTATYTMAYNVPLTGAGAPYPMGTSNIAAWGETASPNGLQNVPAGATAIFPPDEVPTGSPPSDYTRATIYYMDQDGDTVNVAAPGGRISTTAYDANDNIAWRLTAANRVEALTYGQNSANEASLLATQDTYTPDGVAPLIQAGPTHLMQLANGTQVQARQETVDQYDQGNPGGGAVDLLTTQTEQSSYGNSDPRTTTYSYTGQNGLGWTLGEATSVTTDSGGLNLVSTTLYDPTTGAVTESPANTNGGAAHPTQDIYYTTASNSSYPTCGNNPNLAGDLCQTQPAVQPNTPGLPALPVTTYTYNMWGETTGQTDTSGSTTRTTTNSYDAAGRLVTKAVTSSVGQPVPTVTHGYSPTTGLETTQSAGGQTITTGYNAIGEATSYSDADGNYSTTQYDIDGRPSVTTDGKGTQTSSYDPVTGDLTSIVDSAAGTFAATYDADGNMLTETYPNGMTAKYGYDETAAPTSLTYTAPVGCVSSCTWYTDQITSSTHGQWLTQASTLATENYTYDGAGRLTQVQETPTGQGCTTRAYAYDADTNRLSSTSTGPGSGGACSSTGGTTTSHTYDAADRLTDSGVTYDSWGNTLTLPAADAGGSGLTSTYYVNNQLATATQAGETLAYSLDPSGRIRERQGTGNTASTSIDHFIDSTDTPAWTDTGSGTWTRYISGIDGNLAANQTSSGTIALQLINLHGDVIGTVNNTPSATPTLSKNTDEFGVPASGQTPARYDWLGSSQRTTALPSGIIDMGAREYIPELGRFLQTDPVPGGSANEYDYANQDPVNSVDPTGQWATVLSSRQARAWGVAVFVGAVFGNLGTNLMPSWMGNVITAGREAGRVGVNDLFGLSSALLAEAALAGPFGDVVVQIYPLYQYVWRRPLIIGFHYRITGISP